MLSDKGKEISDRFAAELQGIVQRQSRDLAFVSAVRLAIEERTGRPLEGGILHAFRQADVDRAKEIMGQCWREDEK